MGFARKMRRKEDGGAPPEKVVRAESFELVDKAGRIRGRMMTAPAGEVGFSLFNEKGSPRLYVALSGAGDPLILLNDVRGKERLAITVDAEGKPGVMLFDQDGKTRASGCLRTDGTPVLFPAQQNISDRDAFVRELVPLIKKAMDE